MFAAFSRFARGQHGVVHLEQARNLGATTSWLTRQCQRSVLERRTPCVYVLVGAPVTRRQELLVHVLAAGPGALADADSALGLWCPELALPRIPEIVVPRSCGYRPAGAQVHRSSDLHLAKPTVVDSIPVVGVARALLDASQGRTVDQALSRIDACRRHSSLAVGALLEALHAHERRGRPGIEVFRQAVKRLGSTVPDSDFERFVIRDLAAAGVPDPRLHTVVRLPGKKPIELDLDWPGRLLDVELDGRDHVARARTALRDRQRDRLLQVAGYTVARFLWEEYVGDRDGMMSEIAHLLETARPAPILVNR